MGAAFLRMNGAGNAFAVVNDPDGRFEPDPGSVRAWSAPASGVGFDQLIAVRRAPRADAFMRVWNADGSLVETCGNALRCVGRLLIEASGRRQVTIDTLGGPTQAWREDDGRISVDMGRPRLRWDEIPLAEEMDTRNIELQVGPMDAPHLHTPGAVSMGNPHVVFFVADAEAAPVREAGSLIERHPLFPEGVNVGFAEVKAADLIRLRVWERGAGLTLACGTGACAALVAAHRRGLTGRRARLALDGGALDIDWRTTDDHVVMTGDAVLEGAGELP